MDMESLFVEQRPPCSCIAACRSLAFCQDRICRKTNRHSKKTNRSSLTRESLCRWSFCTVASLWCGPPAWLLRVGCSSAVRIQPAVVGRRIIFPEYKQTLTISIHSSCSQSMLQLAVPLVSVPWAQLGLSSCMHWSQQLEIDSR